MTSSHSSSTSLAAKAGITPSKSQILFRSTRQESIKAGLPTIAGSPSKANQPQPALEPLPVRQESREKSHTPTKIPRLYSRYTPTDAKLPPAAPVPHTIIPLRSSRRTTHAAVAISVDSKPESSSTAIAVAQREPGLALGEKSLSSRRRQEVETSQIPRSTSMAAVTGNSVTLSHSQAEPSSTVDRIALRKSQARELLASSQTAAPIPRSFTSGQLTSSASNIRTVSNAGPGSVTSTLTSARRLLSRSTDGNSLAPSPRRAPVSSTETSASNALIKPSRSVVSGISKLAAPSRVPKSTLAAPPVNSTLPDSRSTSASSQTISPTEEEIRADEEMSAYVRRQQTKKLAAGMPADVIQKMFEFPEPTVPQPGMKSRGELGGFFVRLDSNADRSAREQTLLYYTLAV